ncbi:MAG TPA: cellulase family glycosylhydrolase [Ferruginibacter sp.]|nr:cellulase family glycosylhydrolase [Ferruginibacter sp.]
MKKICLFIVLAIACCSIGKGQGTGYVTLKGRQFYDQQGVPFFPMVMNYHVELTHDNPNNPQYKIIRSTIYGTAGCVLEGGYTFNDCETSLAQDFAKMKQMGFNTIRLVGALSPNRNDNGALGFHTLSGSFSDLSNNPSSFCNNKQTIGLDAPYTNADAQLFFNLVKHFMDVADSSNMKVILLCADGSGSYTDGLGNIVYYPDRGSSLTDAQDYAAFLHQLALAINSKPALLAYDLYNEPNYSWYLPGRNMDKNKQTVCDYFTLWYDALKTADPNHLITVGGTDVGDVWNWDTGVMKVDFVSVHFYPNKNELYSSERLLNQIHWFTEALGKPWIVGETGFGASDESCLIPYLDGDNAAQLSFMQAILPSVRDCGGSGFSWWEFQDKHWYCVPDDVCNPTCNYCDNWGGSCGYDFSQNPPVYSAATIAAASNIIFNNYHSFLAYGDPDPITGLYDAGIDKAAVAFTTAFNAGNGTPAPAACTAPTAYYYDPYHHGDFNTNTATYVTGFIQDQDGQPLPNAAVLALNWLDTIDPDINISGDETYIHSWIYTFTNSSASGTNFSVIPYTPYHPNDPRIIYLKISATGASKQEFGQSYPWTDVAISPVTIGNVTLNKINFGYDGQVSNTTITPSSLQQNYSGWNTLTASNNVIVQSGVVSDWKARQEVNLQADFNAQSGSEVHIYTEETFAECADYTGFLRVAQNHNSVGDNETFTKNIELAFTNTKTKPDAEIVPNPNTGMFTVKMLDVSSESLTTLNINNIMGKQLKKILFTGNEVKLNMSNEARGIYMVEITTDKNRILKKLVIN